MSIIREINSVVMQWKNQADHWARQNRWSLVDTLRERCYYNQQVLNRYQQTQDLDQLENDLLSQDAAARDDLFRVFDFIEDEKESIRYV